MLNRRRLIFNPVFFAKWISFGAVLVLLLACGTIPEKAEVGQDEPSGAGPKKESRLRNPEQDAPREDRAALLFEKAMKSLERGQTDQAMEELKEVLALAPQLSVPHNNLGILYKQKGFLDEAIHHYEEAIRLKPDYADAYNNLGIAYREKGRFKESEKAYRQALGLDPGLVEAYYNLGILYELYLNQTAEALRQYQQYVQRNGPKSEEVKLWIALLERRLQAP